MNWRPGPKPGALRFAGDVDVAGGFRAYLIAFIDAKRALHASEHTIKNRRIDIGYFIDWCEARAVQRPDEVTRAMLEQYRQYVFHYRRKDNGMPLTFNCQGKRLIAVRVFFQWLTRSHHLLYNPASELELPRPEQRLPRHILTIAEVGQLLNAIDTAESTGLGVRDRAMLEVLYSTGMRRGELVSLRIDDVDLTRGTAFIRQGKGGKDRMVPVGERACRWVDRYLYQVRPLYLDGEDGPILFLAKHGEGMQGKQLSVIVRKVIQMTNLERFADTHPNAACHLFRHACATHMLENGADIRYIQALLGHANLTSTQIYTQVSILKLKEIHAATHPARLQRRQGDETDADTLSTQPGPANAPAAILDGGSDMEADA